MVRRCESFAATGRGKVRAAHEIGEVNVLVDAVANARAVSGRTDEDISAGGIDFTTMQDLGYAVMRGREAAFAWPRVEAQALATRGIAAAGGRHGTWQNTAYCGYTRLRPGDISRENGQKEGSASLLLGQRQQHFRNIRSRALSSS